MQHLLFEVDPPRRVAPFSAQLLKWIGNKQRFADEIVSFFPERFGTYFEPFLGSGGVLGTLAPVKAVGSDVFRPLVEIWQTLHAAPETLKRWYSDRWTAAAKGEKVEEYEGIKASYNAKPNGADLVFLCRACYGGVVRSRQADGFMSTPCGIHDPIPPTAFARRVDEWHRRTGGTEFAVLDYQEAMRSAKPGDLVY
ncbi:MAG TPA: DNA adenine methylase, partial [Pirellulales bacterium]|nr:DNA adenine methylase [Pirellulales bacterium]